MEVFGLPATLFTTGGAVALLFATIWLIFTGRLVPRSAIDDVRQDRDGWRKAAEAEQEINRVQAGQLSELLELARTTDQVIRALPLRQPRGNR